MKGLATIIWLQLLGSISAVIAANPKFLSASARINGQNLDVSWSETGLGDNPNIDYVVQADSTATYGCFNKGGKNPQASNKQDFSGIVTASVTYSSGKNGRINGGATLTPVAPSSGFSCPAGQTQKLISVTYSDVTVTDTTNGISQSISGTFSSP
ncbi:hypothetical protein AU210_008673 [Fusarium oxysporum f. sp. radicis-cucumerinum]|uniref:Uncharacterized protein n=1 Tax=Fusarium oxysporum f. sp. radicis-cucumerinum TaxID=327505 RepID=A0A2H3GZ76_FUSOX|nr:hypothetical protein AU210_008673 [Fusarium oxysporum f. sp. radicis-cucumerinum]